MAGALGRGKELLLDMVLPMPGTLLEGYKGRAAVQLHCKLVRRGCEAGMNPCAAVTWGVQISYLVPARRYLMLNVSVGDLILTCLIVKKATHVTRGHNKAQRQQPMQSAIASRQTSPN
jgi:hypothetical protein